MSLVILEGPDGGGKSTLAHDLQTRGYSVVHHGPYVGNPNPSLSYFSSMYDQLKTLDLGVNPGRLCFDRSWLSEPIYARHWRGEPSRVARAQQRVLERAALTVQAIVVVCLPSFMTCAQNVKGREGDEHVQDIVKHQAIYHDYEGMAVRGNQVTAVPTIRYNYLKDSVQQLIEQVDHLQRLMGHVKSPGAGVTFGSPVLLVGDQPNSEAHSELRNRVPFWSLNRTGCSAWLADQLDEAGIQEDQLHWVNSHDHDGKGMDAGFVKDLAPRAVVALGQKAGNWCRSHGLAAAQVEHPQFHKRVKAGEPYPLIELLRKWK